MFQLWVQEVARSTDTAHHHTQSLLPRLFLHVGSVIVRRQDTSRACVQVVEPLVGDLRVAQVFDPRDLLPGPFGEYVLQTPESSPVR